MSKPHLRNRPNQISGVGQPPLTLLVNVLLDNTTTKRTVNTLSEACSLSQWVQVKLKGFNLLELSNVADLRHQTELNSLVGNVTDHLYISDPFEWREFVAEPNRPLSLWAYCKNVTQFLLRLDARDLLFITPEDQPNTQASLSLMNMWRGRKLRAFCLMRHKPDAVTYTLCNHVCQFLESTSPSLEYLQLYHWSLSSTDLDILQTCSRLRVLSVTEGDMGYSRRRNVMNHSVEKVLTTVSNLPQLEFFQWVEPNLLLHLADLLCLNRLLEDSFKSLSHFHSQCFHISLFDEDWEDNESFLCTFFSSAEDDPSSNMLQSWVSSLRPDICFKLGQQVLLGSELRKVLLLDSDLCRAVNMDHIPRVV